MGDEEQQEDELLALASIYDESTFSASLDGDSPGGQFSAHLELPQPFHVKVSIVHSNTAPKGNKSNMEAEEGLHCIQYLPPVMLYFTLPVDYPSRHPPNYTLSCKWLTRQQLSRVCHQLDTLWQENQAMVILFLWTDFLKNELLDCLGIKAPLDLSNVVPGRLKRGRLHCGTDAHPSDKSVASCHDPSPCSTLSLGEDAKCSVSGSDVVTAGSRRISVEDVTQCTKPKDLESTNICSTDASSSSYDARAIQDIASQDLLLVTILEHDKGQRQIVFQSSVFTCDVCFLDKLGSQCMQFQGCSHVYCNDCMREYFEVKIEEGNVTCLSCPSHKCESQAHPAQVKDLVSEKSFARYDRLLLQLSLDTMSDVMYCPRKQCGCPVIVDQDANMASCPTCHHVFCIFCKLVYHGVSPCRVKAEEVKLLRATYCKATAEEKKAMERRYGKHAIRQILEDSYTQDWLEEFSKRCPSCGTHIQKIDGCNKMSCTKCHTFFCWICMTVLSRNNPYGHFSTLQSPCFNLLFQGVMGTEEGDMDNDDLDDDWVVWL